MVPNGDVGSTIALLRRSLDAADWWKGKKGKKGEREKKEEKKKEGSFPSVLSETMKYSNVDVCR